MHSQASPSIVYRFGLFQLDFDRGTLLRKGLPVKLQDQPLRVLCKLLCRPGEIVSREELKQLLWPDGTHVEFDGSLNAVVKRLRFALGDDVENPVFIETVAKRGYRFIAPVERAQSSGPDPATELPKRSESFDWQRGQAPSISRQQAGTWRVGGERLLQGGLVLIVLVVVWRYLARRQTTSQTAETVIAVLPFANEATDPDLDYLRYAIANDLVTDLSHARGVTVRPLASTSRYGSQLTDPAAVGKVLRVSYVLAGGFFQEDQNLHVFIELVDVARNNPSWRDELTVPSQELIRLRGQLLSRITQGLLPVISSSAGNRMRR